MNANRMITVDVLLLPPQSCTGKDRIDPPQTAATAADYVDFVQVDVPSTPIADSCCVTAHTLLRALQATPARIDGPANIYFTHDGGRQLVIVLDQTGKTESEDSLLPISDDLSLSLEIEPLLPTAHPARRHSLDLTPAEDKLYWEAYERLLGCVSTLKSRFYEPEIPAWEPDEYAELQIVMSRVTLYEKVQLEARTYQCDREPVYDSPPMDTNDIETLLPRPHRPPRPWENHKDPSVWLTPKPNKKGLELLEWNAALNPIHPSHEAVFNDVGLDQFDFPDNSGYSITEVNQATSKYLESVLRLFPVYRLMLGWKNTMLPIMDVLRLYYFTKRRLDEFVGSYVPTIIPVCGGHIITKDHVFNALGRRASWGSDCLETLELVEKYGPFGIYEDQEVVNVINATSAKSMGSVRFLKLLRAVDTRVKAMLAAQERQKEAESSNRRAYIPSS